MTNKDRKLERGILLFLGLLFTAYGIVVIWQQSFIAIDGLRYFGFADDGLITLRYGWNLAHGEGLVWNAGERIEGITNTLWALQSSLLALFLEKRFLPVGMVVSAIGWLLFTAWVFRKIVRVVHPSSEDGKMAVVMGCIAFVLPLSYSPLVEWGLRGMETSMQAGLIAAGVWAFLSAKGRPAYLGAVMLGLACVTRPDCVVPAGIIYGFRCLAILLKKHSWKHLAMELAPFVGILAVLCLFRLNYYGSVAPNTYILKVHGMPLLERIRLNGFGYIAPFMTITLPLILAVAVSLLMRPRFEKFLLAALPGTILVYTVYVGGDAFDNWRFLAPYIPYAFLVLLLDLPHVFAAVHKHFPDDSLGRLRRNGSYVLAAILFFIFGRPSLIEGYAHRLLHAQQADIENVNTAIWLNQVCKPSASVGVFYAGSVPFYTDFYAYDFLGKSDKYIAQLEPDMSGAVAWAGRMSVPGHNKYDLRYSILEKKPTYVQGVKWGRDDIRKEATELYQPVPISFSTWTPQKSQESILIRKDSPDVDWDAVSEKSSN